MKVLAMDYSNLISGTSTGDLSDINGSHSEDEVKTKAEEESQRQESTTVWKSLSKISR